MPNSGLMNFLGKLLGLTGAFTTIFVISGSVTDPVNAPKLFAIGVFGSAAILVVLASPLRTFLQYQKVVLIALGFFILFMFTSFFLSKAPITQLLYGSYGRNNGLLTYIFLTFILISALCLNSQKSFVYITRGIFVAGFINLAYCLWVIVFGDFIGWNNPYGSILGTLGNPNFIGAFLGIVFSVLFAVALNPLSTVVIRVISLSLLPICFFEIVESHAIQGRVVAAFGSAIVLFMYIRSAFKNWILVGYSLFVTIAGLFALAGALQIGPLTKYIYKTSVSLRGQYWLAGWNTGEAHPFTGVGMDAFGDWYRRMRDPHALVLPGVNTVVNAAHNVPIDIFAFGGWPLFISYLSLIALTGISTFKLVRRTRNFDLTLAIMVTAWSGYQLQSIISINQIGLAVWGWLLSGALIAYERFTRENVQESSNREKTGQKPLLKSQNLVTAQVPIYAFIGGVCGLILALPPLSADIKWRSAQLTNTLPALEDSMTSSYFNPPNSTKYLATIQTLEASQLFEQSHKYALAAVKWNSDVFDLWKFLYLIKNSTSAEKAAALENMKRLDPLNPEVASTQ